MPLVLLLLLSFLTLGKLAGSNDLGCLDWNRLVALDRCGEEHADLLLVVFVLRVLAGRDELGEPGRALEEREEGKGAGAGPAVKRVGSEAAPLVEDKPDSLLGEEVGVSAVGPETRGDEAAVELVLEPALGHLGRLEVLMLGGLVVWIGG